MTENLNPLNYVTRKDIKDLGLTQNDLLTAYQPSGGGVFHSRGGEGAGKTLWIAHLYRYLVDKGIVTPDQSVGNLTFKGKYGEGFTTLKGINLHSYLWDLTHKPYRNKCVVIDEIDSEFPARNFSSKEQTEIALRMWHINKLNNFILMSSHLGNSTDLIFHLASHYIILPKRPDFKTNSLNFTFIDNLRLWHGNFTAHDIIKTMLIYNRQEMTEDTEEENAKKFPKKKSPSGEFPEGDLEGIDEAKEITEFL